MAESEFILLRRFSVNGDAEAFAQIIKQHTPMVYGVCHRILSNREIAAEVVQDTFLQLVRDAAEITDSLSNWLHRVATYKSIDIVRSDSKRKQRELKYAANPGNVDSEDNKAAWREISVFIDEELENLDDQTREVIILRFFENMATNDIAEKCGISQMTVYRWMESGIELLRLKLKSRGVIVSAAVFMTLLSENMTKAAPASLMKKLGKIALAGSKATIGTKIVSGISAGIAVKTKIMVGMLIVLFGAGMTVVFSFIANGENKPASTWELVNSSLRNQSGENSNSAQIVPSDINQLLDIFSQSRQNLDSFIVENTQVNNYKLIWNNVERTGTMHFKSQNVFEKIVKGANQQALFGEILMIDNRTFLKARLILQVIYGMVKENFLITKTGS